MSAKSSLPSAAPRQSPTVVIYRDSWLPRSEGFVVEPADHLHRYRPAGAGLTRQGGADAVSAALQLTLYDAPPTEQDRARLRRFGFPRGWWRSRLPEDVAVVHAHFAPDALVARHIAADLDVPLVVTLHGYDVTTPDSRLARDLPGRSYLRHRAALKRQAALFLPVSEYLLGEMLRRRWPAERTVRHYIGVDVDFWSKQTPARPPEAALLFVGRLVPLKNADAVIRAVLTLLLEVPDLSLDIVGEGPDRARLEELARPAGARIRFHGGLGKHEIRDLLHGSRAVVAPSRAWKGRREALNLVVLEAAAAGVPAVAYDSGGISEAVKADISGLLVQENDEGELVRQIRYLLQNDDLVRRLGSEAMRLVRRNFSMRDQAHALEQLYDRAVTEFEGRKRHH